MNLDKGDTRLIIDECAREKLSIKQAAYVLATAYWETARTMKPVRESKAKSDQQAINRLENAWKRGKLPWVTTPYWRDGWFGRGYVQLTHEYNYAKAGAKLAVDLVSNPSLALVPEHAVIILVRGSKEGWFTGKKLSDYITETATDFKNARRIINGTDKASTIADLAFKYHSALVVDGYRPGRATYTVLKGPKTHWLTALINFFKKIANVRL